MKRIIATGILACCLAAPATSAEHQHATGAASAKPDAAAPAAPGGTSDPRAYFTDSELLTQDGRRIKFYSDMLKDKTVVLSVMYTSCTDACPLITRQMVEVREDLGPLFGKKVYFVSLSNDPARDTPRAMKAFAKKQSADVEGWTFLTGAKNNVEVVLKRLGAYSENVEEHPTVLYIMDVDHKRMRKMLPNLPPKAIAEAVRLIASGEGRPAAGPAPKLN